jgi:hypothetical protein
MKRYLKEEHKMFDNNKGFLGMFRYEDTPLEVKEDDSLGMQLLKGTAHGLINASIIVGSAVIIAAQVLRVTNND